MPALSYGQVRHHAANFYYGKFRASGVNDGPGSPNLYPCTAATVLSSAVEADQYTESTTCLLPDYMPASEYTVREVVVPASKPPPCLPFKGIVLCASSCNRCPYCCSFINQQQ
eukprot:1155761-Pelagomonas_calceolata.AAC.3